MMCGDCTWALTIIDAGCMVITHGHGPQCKVCNLVMLIAKELPGKASMAWKLQHKFSQGLEM
jgi:carbamate kinase